MKTRPLDPPTDKELLDQFTSHFAVDLTAEPAADVMKVAKAFSRLPYENLTKILRHAAAGKPVYRTPQTVLDEHIRLGAGGTCFSLTSTLLHLVRSLGLRAEAILADRPYGQNTHSALVVWLDDKPHLVDPGYLIHRPIPLDEWETTRVATSFNDLVLTSPGRDRLELATVQQGKSVHRVTFKLQPADETGFLAAWDASFDWDMMHYPLLTRVDGATQLYLQKRRLQARKRDAVTSEIVDLSALTKTISATFGLAEPLVHKALTLLQSRGDLDD